MFFFFRSIAHILLFSVFLPFPPPVWVYHRCCYTSSRYIYTNWCHTSGDSLSACTKVLRSCILPWLGGLKPTGMWLLVAVLQVQINPSSPPNKRTIVSSQPGTQARLKWAGKYWYNNDKSLRVCSVMGLCVLRVSVRFRGGCHRGDQPVCLISLSPGMQIYCIESHRLCHARQIFPQWNNNIAQHVWMFHVMPVIDSWSNLLLLTAREGCSANSLLPLLCVIWYRSCHGNYLHLKSVNFFFLFFFFFLALYIVQ